MDIIKAIKSKKLFRPAFKNFDSWQSWFVLLRAFFGLKMEKHPLIYLCSVAGARCHQKGILKSFSVSAAVEGGKSCIASIMATYLALFYDYSDYLAPGKKVIIQIVAADRGQAQVILRYIIKGGLKQYQADLDNAVNNRADFNQRLQATGPAQMYKDCQQKLKTVNAASDDGDLNYLAGDSKGHRRPDWHPAKISLSPEAKQKIMRDAEVREITLENELVRYGLVERMAAPEIDTSDDEALKKLTLAEAGEYLTQDDYERWRQLNDKNAVRKEIPTMPVRNLVYSKGR